MLDTRNLYFTRSLFSYLFFFILISINIYWIRVNKYSALACVKKKKILLLVFNGGANQYNQCDCACRKYQFGFDRILWHQIFKLTNGRLLHRDAFIVGSSLFGAAHCWRRKNVHPKWHDAAAVAFGLTFRRSARSIGNIDNRYRSIILFRDV